VTSHWMCAMASQINLATRCGAPRERNGQFRALWCDPPRSPLCREWVDFLCGWHRIVHRAGFWRRGTTPPAPPTIWEFCQRYDLPVPPWATLNAELHGWEHLRPVANRLNSRHAYLVSLSRETRLRLYTVESEMRSMERDRQWASEGLVQTDPCTWRSILLLKDRNTNTEPFSDSY
jgi:hypothetical protein